MPSREYHEQLWESVPRGLEPDRFGVRLRFLLAHVPAGARVLDVGCGEGRFATELARAGARVVGIDVAEEPLRRARERDRDLDLRLVDDEASWPLDDASFDVVWAGEVIEHVADTARWLSEVRRVLRSGGVLLVSTPAHGRREMVRLAFSRRAFAAHFEPLGEHLRFYSLQTLTRLLEEFAFEDVRVERSGAGGLSGGRAVLLSRAVRSRF